MKLAMGLLAVGAFGAGFLQIPWVTHAVESFLAPSFRGSRYFEGLNPSDGLTAFGLVAGTVIGLAGIALAYRLWVVAPETPARFCASREDSRCARTRRRTPSSTAASGDDLDPMQLGFSAPRRLAQAPARACRAARLSGRRRRRRGRARSR